MLLPRDAPFCVGSGRCCYFQRRSKAAVHSRQAPASRAYGSQNISTQKPQSVIIEKAQLTLGLKTLQVRTISKILHLERQHGNKSAFNTQAIYVTSDTLTMGCLCSQTRPDKFQVWLSSESCRCVVPMGRIANSILGGLQLLSSHSAWMENQM